MTSAHLPGVLRHSFLLAMFSASSLLAAQSWEEIAPLPQASAGFARGALPFGPVLLGGSRWEKDRKVTMREGWVYIARDNRWAPLPALPHGLSFAAFGVQQESLYILGGDDGLATSSALVVVTGREPVAIIHKLVQPVVYAGSTAANGRLYVVGGATDALAPLRMHGDFLSVDLASGRLMRLPEHPSGGLIHAAVASVGDLLFAFTGGRAANAPARIVNTNQSWTYSLTTRTWTSLPDYPFPVRGLSACVLDDRHILLAGGFRDAAEEDLPPYMTDASFVYDTVDRTYRPTLAIPYAGMAVGLVLHDGWVYVFGGENAPRQRVSTAYRIKVATLLRD